MAQVSFSQMINAEQTGDTGLCGKNLGALQGTLKTEGKEYLVFVFSDSESVTEAVFKFLSDINQQERPLQQLLDFEFFPMTQEMIETENEIFKLLQELAIPHSIEKGHEASKGDQKNLQEYKKQTSEGKLESADPKHIGKPESSYGKSETGHTEVIYSSLFTLARSFHTSLTETRQKSAHQERGQEQKTHSREESQSQPAHTTQLTRNIEANVFKENQMEREGNGKQEQGEQDDEQKDTSHHEQQKKSRSIEERKKKRIGAIGALQASREESSSRNSQTTGGKSTLAGIENIYIRFMALMARILGQAELEAHELYVKIKERTDAIDVLTLLVSKINSEKGPIDWSNNEEMKKLIGKARALGVEIPDGKFKWSEEEKKLLKENIQMRKDSMEKMTQLERTDMQRYLQEASQCHQARSNVLKVMKEVIDTFVHNIRPA